MSLNTVSQEPVEIFISYSRKDRKYAEELKKRLKIDGRLNVWYDENLTPGEAWEDEIYSHFRSARIILLLVSPDFFNSVYCYRLEMPASLNRSDATVVPVIIRTCGWQRTPLAKLMVLPKNGKPVSKWKDKDQYYQDVATSLFERLDELFGAVPAVKTSPWDVSLPNSGRDASVALRNPVADPDPVIVPNASTGALPRASSPMDFCNLVKAEQVRIVVCFIHPERRNKLPGLRKWCQQTGNPQFAEQPIQIVEAKDLKGAVQLHSEKPETTILLLDGFEPGTPQLDEFTETADWTSRFELIINSPEWDQFSPQTLSASILQPRQSNSCDETLFSTLRKSLLRVRTRQYAAARVLETPDEMAAFFELRYRVWSELKYLSEEKICQECPWELDYTDRTSLPLGIFSKIDGNLLGGARLVRGFGEDYPKLIHTVTAMVQARQADTLLKNFQYPTSTTHPFDILGELDRFKEYYRDLVRSRVSKAEVSRVVVAPEYRQLGFGEIIVDTVCTLARINAIHVLFLACRSTHADFYKRCQFKVVGGVAGNKFLTYRVPCIAMEKRL